MTTVHWIALSFCLLVFAVIVWILLSVLWLIGKVPERIVTGTWNVRPYLIKWMLFSLILALGVSFVGIWVVEGNPPIPGASESEVKDYQKAIVKESVSLALYAMILISIQIAWSYGCILVSLVTGKFSKTDRETNDAI